jgi:hypothetical protein
MISCLEYDLKKKIDIICMQESWIESNQIIISHSTFNRILSEQKETHKQRVIIFVSKTFKFSITSRSNLCSNTNIQILNISRTNIENFTIINVYNEKCQKSSSDEYTIEKKLKSIKLTKNSFVCDDSTLIISDETLESRHQFEQMHWLNDWINSIANWSTYQTNTHSIEKIQTQSLI